MHELLFVLLAIQHSVTAAVAAAHQNSSTAAAVAAAAVAGGLHWDYTAATALAEALRSLVKQSLGLTVSAGVAPNRFLAKLASRVAKPDGVWCIDSVGAVQQLLRDTPVDRLPGNRRGFFCGRGGG
jgi:nucleotidyltransferase/DNA polymerase involved in DNA repair